MRCSFCGAEHINELYEQHMQGSTKQGVCAVSSDEGLALAWVPRLELVVVTA